MFFTFFIISVALAQNTMGVTTTTTMAAASGNGPLAPQMRPCAPRWLIEWMGNNPPSLRMYFLGGLRVCMALKVFLCSGDDSLPQHWNVLRAIHPFNSPPQISTRSGGCRPSILCIGLEHKASCGALGGHFRQRRPWLAMIVLVVVGTPVYDTRYVLTIGRSNKKTCLKKIGLHFEPRAWECVRLVPKYLRHGIIWFCFVPESTGQPSGKWDLWIQFHSIFSN